MRQVTLVAFYEDKPTCLWNLIYTCQDMIGKTLGARFIPYSKDQIHGTIVGLAQDGTTGLNRNLVRRYGQQSQKIMDFGGLLRFIRQGGKLPFSVQIGGFQNRDYPFLSRGKTPYERSFSIQGDKAVIMGWPILGKPLNTAPANVQQWLQESRIYPNTLDKIRRSMQSFHILHAYHSTPTDVDNDFYFRIGLIVNPSSLNYSLCQSLQTQIRTHLSSMRPVIIEVTISSIYLVSYVDPTLPRSSTEAYVVSDTTRVKPSFIWSLYR